MEKFLLDIIAKKAKYGKNSNIFDLMYETNLPYSAINPLLDLMITRYQIERIDIETYRYIGDMCGSNREAESRETEYVSEQRRQALSMLMRVLEQRGRQLEKRSQGNDDGDDLDDDDDLDESSDRNRTALEALKARLSQLIQDIVDSEKDRLELLEKDDDEYEEEDDRYEGDDDEYEEDDDEYEEDDDEYEEDDDEYEEDGDEYEEEDEGYEEDDDGYEEEESDEEDYGEGNGEYDGDESRGKKRIFQILEKIVNKETCGRSLKDYMEQMFRDQCKRALQLFVEKGYATEKLLQKYCYMDFYKASFIIEYFVKKGYISAEPRTIQFRKVLVSKEEFQKNCDKWFNDD